MGLHGKKIEMNVKGIKGEKFALSNCEKVDFEVIGEFGRQQIKGAISSSNVSLPTQTLPAEFINSLKLPPGITIRPYRNAKASILIGQDNWRVLASRDIMTVENLDIAIARTSLGWTIHGPTFSKSNARPVMSCQCEESMKGAERVDGDEKLDDLMRNYFELESISVNSPGAPRSKHDRASKILETTSCFLGDHWETGLLWRADKAPRVNSYPMAFKRLQFLEKRLDKDIDYARLYYKEMQRFIDRGYAVKVNENMTRDRIWYIPHFGVTNINKPNKIRLVFDAAAKTNGVSFNDQLESGPDLLQSLPGVLIRFRQHKVAVKGDIKDMFLRVKIRESDRGAQRFLWRGMNRDSEPDLYEMNSLIFGSKSSPCSALYIKDRNADTFKIKNSDAHTSIKRNSYMDDYLVSCVSEEKARALVTEVSKINSIAGFEMHSWASSHNNIVPTQTTTSVTNETSLCDRGGERVLGLFWDPASDSLKFNVECKKIPTALMNGSKIPTKRDVLRVVMSVFDPLGILAPFTVKSKLLMQSIWRSGTHWDRDIKQKEVEKWLMWLSQLKNLKDCNVPRCMSFPNFNPDFTQLHVFCDASLEAYAAVAYLRFINNNGVIRVSLVMAKSRLAGSKPMTVPRLELQGALLGARLAQYIQSECDFQLAERYFWSDSTTVLSWLDSEPRSKSAWVSYRLGDIADLSTISEWRWVPSELNPADDATRFTEDELRANTRWFQGPPFLYRSQESWPKENLKCREEREAAKSEEKRKNYVGLLTKLERTKLPLTIRLAGWSGLLVLARRMRNAINRLCEKRRMRGGNLNPPKSIELSQVELAQKYENIWLWISQTDSFRVEMEILKKKEKFKTLNSRIAPLKPFLDEDGILRASGRVKVHGLNFNNNPIILDGKHFVTKEIIREYHRRFHHGSNNTVVNELRQTYQIVGLRKILRSIASKCIVCRLQRAKPFSPQMGNLLPGQVAYRLRVFSHCGLDYFGPLLVTIGRRREKRWGALFTCLTTRAIYIELVHSLSADSTIMAIKRLAANRGRPMMIYSDNASNFHKAEKELKEQIKELDKKKIGEFMLKRKIDWRFNPPDAPFMGGAWERLIGCVKTALYTILKDQAPREEVLLTTLAEISHTVNSRPLTHVSLDPRDEEALTPNHFLIGTSSGEVDVGRYDVLDKCPKKLWKISQNFADAFWKRWLREYLPTLTPRQKWTSANDAAKAGDIVMIIDLQAPRNCWRKGKITKVFPGRDGEVRVAEVKTPEGTYIRPTRKLIKLLGVDEVQK